MGWLVWELLYEDLGVAETFKATAALSPRRVGLSDQVLTVGLSREAVLNVLAKLCYQDVPSQEEKVKATLPNTWEGASASSTPDFSPE